MLQNIPKEKILEIVKQGPTIPQKIVKIVGGDTMLIGAILSTMISTGEVKYSILKFGGSPLYYVPEDEPKLENYLNHLNEKDQKTVKALKEQKVMHDATQDPLTKFSLKTIKDFAKPFTIDKQLFYRYFLTSVEEAESIAQKIIKTLQPKEEPKIEHAVKEEPPITIIENTSVSAPKEDYSETKHKIKEHKEKTHIKETIKKRDFFEIIKEHVHELGLDIVGKEKIKKSEYALVLKNHDSNEYIYCVAKDKKTINEGDLSTAFVFSHQKKMSCIFLMTGHLTKNAESMSQKEFKDMKIEQI